MEVWLEIIDMAASEDGVGIENVGLRETLTSLDRSIQSLILFFEESDVRPRGSDLWLSTTRGGKPETDRTTAAGCACSSSSSCSALELGGRRRLQPCVNGRRDRPCYPGPCSTPYTLHGVAAGNMNSSSSSAPNTLSSKPIDTRRQVT
jgi:hypothetical protein